MAEIYHHEVEYADTHADMAAARYRTAYTTVMADSGPEADVLAAQMVGHHGIPTATRRLMATTQPRREGTEDRADSDDAGAPAATWDRTHNTNRALRGAEKATNRFERLVPTSQELGVLREGGSPDHDAWAEYRESKD